MRGIFGRIVSGFSRQVGGIDSTEAMMEGISGSWWSSPSASGISINQQTALQSTAVMACVRVLSEDISKMPLGLFRRLANGDRTEVTDTALANVLWQPNDWQTQPEFLRQMVASFAMRGNAYAVIVRDGRGDPVMLVPINPDHVVLFEAPDGHLFWLVTRQGLHELWVLRGFPFLIPYDSMLHIKDLSANGLIGLSPISIAREAIAASLAMEQQQVRMMANGSRPSGVLTTDKVLTPEIAERLKKNWQDLHSGLLNSGGTAVLEAGLSWQALSLSSVDAQFLQLRNFQVEEIARVFRIPPHLIAASSGRMTGTTLVELNQAYRNTVLTSHTSIWERRIDMAFGLRKLNMFCDFDEDAMLRADITARYNANRVGIMTGWLTLNDVRQAEGLPRVEIPEADELWMAANLLPISQSRTVAAATAAGPGSDLSGEAPDGAGRPKGTPKPNGHLPPGADLPGEAPGV